MRHRSQRSLVSRLLLIPALITATPSLAQEKARYSDDRYQFKLSVPSPWKEAPVAGYKVPGTVRAAWAGKENASIVAFVQEPGRAFTPRFLTDASAQSMEQQLGAKILEKEVKPVGGKQAMWLSFEAKGNGAAIVPNGDVPMTQHWVAIPREKDIVVLLLTCRSGNFKELEKSFADAIKGLEVGGKQTDEQAGSK